jgi:hypothetical protein
LFLIFNFTFSVSQKFTYNHSCISDKAQGLEKHVKLPHPLDTEDKTIDTHTPASREEKGETKNAKNPTHATKSNSRNFLFKLIYSGQSLFLSIFAFSSFVKNVTRW